MNQTVEYKVYHDLLLNWQLCKRMSVDEEGNKIGLDEIIRVAEQIIEDLKKH